MSLNEARLPRLSEKLEFEAAEVREKEEKKDEDKKKIIKKASKKK